MNGRIAVQELLRKSLVHVPTKGFTVAAIRQTLQEYPNVDAAKLDRALAALFPGPDSASTAGPRRLWQAWDNEVLKRMKQEYSNKGTETHAYESTVDWLCERLKHSVPVRSHLLPAFTLLASEPLLGQSPTLIPFLSKTPTIPNPGPVMARAVQIAEDATFATDLVTEKGTEWFTKRSRLAFSYGTAELALVTQPSMTQEQAINLLRRLATTPGAYEFLRQHTQSLRLWVEWGGRGWLGILRSLGL